MIIIDKNIKIHSYKTTLSNLILILFSLIILSCNTNENDSLENDNLLIGNWAKPIYKKEIITFKRVTNFPKEEYGISFDNESNFIEQTSGWCGTPPLTFFTIKGNYQLKNMLINISTNSFPENYTWKIENITNDQLVVKRVFTKQEIEHQNLIDLFHEIENLAYSKTCTNEKDWTFTAFGAQACGGPQGFLPYSKKIDTVNFLNKVKEYTKKENEFNKKWGILSVCNILSKPLKVTCINNSPTLVFVNAIVKNNNN